MKKILSGILSFIMIVFCFTLNESQIVIAGTINECCDNWQEEIIFQEHLHYAANQTTCQSCGGSGKAKITQKFPCSICHGTGKFQGNICPGPGCEGKGYFYYTSDIVCPSCGGTGNINAPAVTTTIRKTTTTTKRITTTRTAITTRTTTRPVTTRTTTTKVYNPDDSKIKPTISLSRIEIPIDEALENPTQKIELSVKNADYKYAATGFFIDYDSRLSIIKDEYGCMAEIGPTQRLNYDMTGNGDHGFFVLTGGMNNNGRDGVLWTFYLILPSDCKVGDLYPIEIMNLSTKNLKSVFTNSSNDEEGQLMQSWVFSKGIEQGYISIVPSNYDKTTTIVTTTKNITSTISTSTTSSPLLTTSMGSNRTTTTSKTTTTANLKTTTTSNTFQTTTPPLNTTTTTLPPLRVEKTELTLFEKTAYILGVNRKDVTYKSDNTNVAVVSDGGLLETISPGSAIISVIAPDSNVVQIKVVVNSLPTSSTTTTFTITTTTTTTTNGGQLSKADISFSFVDKNGKSSISAKPGDEITVYANIKADGKPVSAMDVQFKVGSSLKITQIGSRSVALGNKPMSTNIDEYRANFISRGTDGEPLVPEDGKAAFTFVVSIPEGTANGTYTVGFGRLCNVFKDTTNFTYETSFVPLEITVGEEVITTTTSSTTTEKTTANTTTSTATSTSTLTTTGPIQSPQNYPIGDVNNDGLVDAVDASSVLAYYAMISTNRKGDYSEDQKTAADVNKDGLINAVDASNILAYYAYISTTREEILTIEVFLKKRL